MDACRTALDAVSIRLCRGVALTDPQQQRVSSGFKLRRLGNGWRPLVLGSWCFFLLVGATDAWLVAEESRRVVVTSEKPTPEVNEAVLAYQNLGQFHGKVYVTRNFRVHAANSQLAQAVGDRAEGYRELLAMQWLGYTLPDWEQSCPIEVTVSNQAHGETSFLLSENGVALPSDWEMKVNGPTDRLLDSVLPHEITHTIFASHFKQRLPRWADEGACTTIEHSSEREKIHTLLLRYLSPQQRQGIPFNRMFPMREYPSDMLPLYAQGYSVAKFLIAQGGHRQFVQLVERGLQRERQMPVTVAWDQAMRETYGYQDLSELQLDWLKWVGEGSQESAAVARMEQRSGVRLASFDAPEQRGPAVAPANFADPNSAGPTDENFYVQQMRAGLSGTAAPAGNSIQPESPSPNLTPIVPAVPNSATQNSRATVGQPTYRSDSTILLPPRLR
ncbi:MAG: hypothetical protein Q8M16_05060 [Pirellulaceae bacterium]|nr:hypothetical protein [Pirellulaceae bacterium]